MIDQPEHNSNEFAALTPAERLELERVDRVLSRLAVADRARTPARLVERVFAASAALLPVPEVLRGPWQSSREAASRRRLVRASVWGRLALAASLALAFIIAQPALRGSNNSLLSPEVALIVSNTSSDPLQNLLGSRNMWKGGGEAAYMESFGIFDTRAGDLLGEISAMLEAAPES